jgi:Na+-translocating ferredoxin:NAD+ oxidoreductase RnfG subunit
MVAVDADGKVLRVEVLAFREPQDYLPRDLWYGQFDGKKLDDDLDVKRAIRGVTGATLTVRATTDAVRRILAIHRLLTASDPPAEAGTE